MVCLPDSIGIQGLHIDGAAGRSILLGAYDHPVAVSHRCAHRNWFNYTEADVTVQSRFDFILPMDGDWDGVWCATGLASGSIIKRIGGPFIIGSGVCVHVLNVDEA